MSLRPHRFHVSSDENLGQRRLDGMSTHFDASRISRPSERLRILVVDDFAPFPKSLCSLLLDCETLTIVGEAADGESAIEMAFRLLPQVIIMDVKMPGISGVEATRRIKRFLPAVHVIGISTRDDTFIRESLRAVGSSHFLTKDCAHTLPEVIAQIAEPRDSPDKII